MNGSRKIRVVKRDGTEEVFDPEKLAGAMARAMGGSYERFRCCRHIALGIGIYLRRSRWHRISSGAILEMVVKVLVRLGWSRPAERLQAHHRLRQDRRERLKVCHEGGEITLWDKSWLSQLAQRSWFLLPTTGRILAGQIERELLDGPLGVVSRRDVLDRLNRRVAEYGLADAVPVRSSSAH